MAENVGGIYYELDLKQDKFNKGAAQASSRLSRLSNQFDKLRQVGNIALGGIAAVGVGVLGMAGQAINAAAQFETMGVALTTALGGNKKAAKQAQDQITQFAAKTPYQLQEVMNAFIKLKNMGLNPSQQALTAYGDTASAMGKSLNDMVEAVADAATGEFERLKEFGIRASSEGDKVKFTFQGVTTTVKKNSKDIENYLIGIGKTKFAGGMEEQSQTFLGQLSTLKDNASLIFADIANNSGFFDLIKRGIGSVSAFLESHKPNIIEFFNKLGQVIEGVIVILRGGDGISTDLFDGILPQNKAQQVIDNIEGIKNGLAPLFGLMVDNKDVLFDLGVNFGLLNGALGLVTPAIQLFSSPLLPVYIAIGLIAFAITAWNKNLFNVRDRLIAVWEVLKRVWQVIAPVLVPAFRDLANTIVTQLWPALQNLWNFLSPVLIPVLKVLGVILGMVLIGAFMLVIGIIWATIKVIQVLVTVIAAWVNYWIYSVKRAIEQVKGMYAAVRESFGQIGGKIGELINWFKGIPEKIKQVLRGVGDAILSPFNKAFDQLKSKLNEAKNNLDKLNPFHRESPSLVDWIEKGTDKMVNLYDNMFDHLASTSSANRVGMVAAAKTIGGIDKSSSEPIAQSSTTAVLNLSGVMARSRGELRDVAMDIVDLANEQLRAEGKAPIGSFKLIR